MIAFGCDYMDTELIQLLGSRVRELQEICDGNSEYVWGKTIEFRSIP